MVMIDDDAVVGGEFATDRLRFKPINRQLIYHHRVKLGRHGGNMLLGLMTLQ